MQFAWTRGPPTDKKYAFRVQYQCMWSGCGGRSLITHFCELILLLLSFCYTHLFINYKCNHSRSGRTVYAEGDHLRELEENTSEKWKLIILRKLREGSLSIIIWHCLWYWFWTHIVVVVLLSLSRATPLISWAMTSLVNSWLSTTWSSRCTPT